MWNDESDGNNNHHFGFDNNVDGDHDSHDEHREYNIGAASSLKQIVRGQNVS